MTGKSSSVNSTLGLSGWLLTKGFKDRPYRVVSSMGLSVTCLLYAEGMGQLVAHDQVPETPCTMSSLEALIGHWQPGSAPG